MCVTSVGGLGPPHGSDVALQAGVEMKGSIDFLLHVLYCLPKVQVTRITKSHFNPPWPSNIDKKNTWSRFAAFITLAHDLRHLAVEIIYIHIKLSFQCNIHQHSFPTSA